MQALFKKSHDVFYFNGCSTRRQIGPILFPFSQPVTLYHALFFCVPFLFPCTRCRSRLAFSPNVSYLHSVCSATERAMKPIKRKINGSHKKMAVHGKRQQPGRRKCERQAHFIGLPFPCTSISTPHFAQARSGIPVLRCLPCEDKVRLGNCYDNAGRGEEKRQKNDSSDLPQPEKPKKKNDSRDQNAARSALQQEQKVEGIGIEDARENQTGNEGKKVEQKSFVRQNKATAALFDLDEGVKMMELMVKVQTWDSVLFNIQRQGRISFYMTCAGEEASLVGSAAALQKEDIVLPQYRELPVLLWRGLSLDNVLAQLFANQDDPGKGRQMPVHYAAPGINVHPVSSPLGNKVTQAAGVGYALKLKKADALAVVYFGEGAASQGDADVGLNFAAVLQSQTLFICRNNGYAISTPAKEQYRGDGIAARAVAYGVDALRVDGTDLIAVYAGVKAARERALKHKKPVLVEMMTYRLGHHSTSDDSTRYREKREVIQWASPCWHPIIRFSKYLESQGRWDQKKHEACKVAAEAEFRQKLREAEKKRHPPLLSGLFDDVYSESPLSLKEQRESLRSFLLQEEAAKHYALHQFAEDSLKENSSESHTKPSGAT